MALGSPEGDTVSQRPVRHRAFGRAAGKKLHEMMGMGSCKGSWRIPKTSLVSFLILFTCHFKNFFFQFLGPNFLKPCPSLHSEWRGKQWLCEDGMAPVGRVNSELTRLPAAAAPEGICFVSESLLSSEISP